MKVPIEDADEKKPGTAQPSEAEPSTKDAPAAKEAAASTTASSAPGDIDPEDDAVKLPREGSPVNPLSRLVQ